MKIITLLENTPGNNACGCEHGLCFYIETKKHKLLMDTGASELFIKNAEKLGVDLKKVDTVVLSHAHDDHTGGMPAFLKINKKAKVYLQKAAAEGRYFGVHGDTPEEIGLPKELAGSKAVTLVDGDVKIDDELSLFIVKEKKIPVPRANSNLKMMGKDGLVADDFRHEQCLVINCEGKKLLFSGCAHNGILNIIEQYKKLYGVEPDMAFSGFHMLQRKG